jgi:hypothetical protein
MPNFTNQLRRDSAAVDRTKAAYVALRSCRSVPTLPVPPGDKHRDGGGCNPLIWSYLHRIRVPTTAQNAALTNAKYPILFLEIVGRHRDRMAFNCFTFTGLANSR